MAPKWPMPCLFYFGCAAITIIIGAVRASELAEGAYESQSGIGQTPLHHPPSPHTSTPGYSTTAARASSREAPAANFPVQPRLLQALAGSLPPATTKPPSATRPKPPPPRPKSPPPRPKPPPPSRCPPPRRPSPPPPKRNPPPPRRPPPRSPPKPPPSRPRPPLRPPPPLSPSPPPLPVIIPSCPGCYYTLRPSESYYSFVLNHYGIPVSSPEYPQLHLCLYNWLALQNITSFALARRIYLPCISSLCMTPQLPTKGSPGSTTCAPQTGTSPPSSPPAPLLSPPPRRPSPPPPSKLPPFLLFNSTRSCPGCFYTTIPGESLYYFVRNHYGLSIDNEDTPLYQLCLSLWLLVQNVASLSTPSGGPVYGIYLPCLDQLCDFPQIPGPGDSGYRVCRGSKAAPPPPPNPPPPPPNPPGQGAFVPPCSESAGCYRTIPPEDYNDNDLILKYYGMSDPVNKFLNCLLKWILTQNPDISVSSVVYLPCFDNLCEDPLVPTDPTPPPCRMGPPSPIRPPPPPPSPAVLVSNWTQVPPCYERAGCYYNVNPTESFNDFVSNHYGVPTSSFVYNLLVLCLANWFAEQDVLDLSEATLVYLPCYDSLCDVLIDIPPLESDGQLCVASAPPPPNTPTTPTKPPPPTSPLPPPPPPRTSTAGDVFCANRTVGYYEDLPAPKGSPQNFYMCHTSGESWLGICSAGLVYDAPSGLCLRKEAGPLAEVSAPVYISNDGSATVSPALPGQLARAFWSANTASAWLLLTPQGPRPTEIDGSGAPSYREGDTGFDPEAQRVSITGYSFAAVLDKLFSGIGSINITVFAAIDKLVGPGGSESNATTLTIQLFLQGQGSAGLPVLLPGILEQAPPPPPPAPASRRSSAVALQSSWPPPGIDYQKGRCWRALYFYRPSAWSSVYKQFCRARRPWKVALLISRCFREFAACFSRTAGPYPYTNFTYCKGQEQYHQG